jgi:hypothetical protein
MMTAANHPAGRRADHRIRRLSHRALVALNSHDRGVWRMASTYDLPEHGPEPRPRGGFRAVDARGESVMTLHEAAEAARAAATGPRSYPTRALMLREFAGHLDGPTRRCDCGEPVLVAKSYSDREPDLYVPAFLGLAGYVPVFGRRGAPGLAFTMRPADGEPVFDRHRCPVEPFSASQEAE